MAEDDVTGQRPAPAPPIWSLLQGLAPQLDITRSAVEARVQGTSIFETVIANGHVPVEALLERLQERLGLPDASCVTAADLTPLRDAEKASVVLRAGVAQLRDGRFLIAARGEGLMRVVRVLRTGEAAGKLLMVVPPATFTRLIFEANPELLAEDAAAPPLRQGLSVRSMRRRIYLSAGALILTAFAGFLPGPVGHVFHFGAIAVFLAMASVRLAAAADDPIAPAPRFISDRDLPYYTVLVPLKAEAEQVERLVGALARLDWPRARLDVKILVEEEDAATRDALERVRLPAYVEVIACPKGNPGTKPRALNIGLRAARGQLITVYDAEDEPEPRQLKVAYAAFRDAQRPLACVQARLVIDNTSEAWLARMFGIEYAALFDVFLPFLARRNMFLPLGGTSNHFRTEILRRVGGWDAWNVTEDADLGTRLVRLGYRIGVIPSVTLEEAPTTWRVWRRQRARWLKGWLATWVVHGLSPEPDRLRGVQAWFFHVLVLGGALGPLQLPVFLLQIAWRLWQGGIAQLSAPFAVELLALDAAVGLAGYLACVLLLRRGVRHRDPPTRLRDIALFPLTYWPLISIAAWQALVGLVASPWGWNKTPHTARRRRPPPWRERAETQR